MKNIDKFKKISLEELKDTWEKVASDCLPSFEDYVSEVRKIESDLHAGWTMQEKLKITNNEKLHEE